MLYPDFERAFEARLQTYADAYSNAVEYHRVRFGQTIEYLFRSILEQTDALVQLRFNTASVLSRIGCESLDC